MEGGDPHEIFCYRKKKQLDDIAVSGTRRHSRAADIWLRLVRDKSAVVSLVLLGIIILLAIFANVLFDESAITTQNINIRNCPPSWEHWFGTDLYGRDIFIRMVFGSRVSLLIGIVTMVASMVIGGLLGAVAAYFGKATDSIIMRLTDMFMAIPETLLALCVVAAMGASAVSLIVGNDGSLRTGQLSARALYGAEYRGFGVCRSGSRLRYERFADHCQGDYP